jgi:hypothetical protein
MDNESDLNIGEGDPQVQRMDQMSGGASNFTPFHQHVRKEIEEATQGLRAELEQANWEKDAAETELRDRTAKLDRTQSAYMEAQSRIILLQSQLNAQLASASSRGSTAQQQPPTTTVQNIIQRKADDKISKLRLSRDGHLKKQDVWVFCEEVETAMRTGPVDVKSFMSTEVRDQVRFAFLTRFPGGDPWTTWADQLVLERLKEVYPRHRETLFAADTIEDVARKWRVVPGRATEDTRAHLGLVAGLQTRLAASSTVDEAQFIESMVKKLGSLYTENFFEGRVASNLLQFLTAITDGGVPKTVDDYGVKASKHAEFMRWRLGAAGRIKVHAREEEQ